MKEQHKNRCLFCSLGCGFIIETAFDEAVNLEYDRDDPVGGGSLCSKGNYMLELLNHPMRLIEPCTGGKVLSWKEVLGKMADRLASYAGTESAGLILDGDASTEDIITAQFFAEKCLGNNRIAVHFATGDDRVYRALASANIPNPPAQPGDIEKTGCIIAVGDPFEVGPVISGRALKVKYAKRGNTLTVISNKPNRTSRFATAHLAGPERKALAGLLHAAADRLDGKGPEWLKVVKEEYPAPDDPAVVNTAKSFLETPSAVLILETQDPVTARLAAAVVTAAGSDKRLYCVNTYGNAGGICEVFEGNDSVDGMLDAVEKGELKALLVLGADIVKGHAGRDVKAALKKLDYLAAGAPFENRTTEMADPVLPTALWLETEGTYNGKLMNPVIEPPGGALSYGEIIRRLTSKMGAQLPPVSRESVLKREELTGEVMRALLKDIGEEAPEPAFQSTTIDYADGSITGNMSWIKLQEREPW